MGGNVMEHGKLAFSRPHFKSETQKEGRKGSQERTRRSKKKKPRSRLEAGWTLTPARPRCVLAPGLQLSLPVRLHLDWTWHPLPTELCAGQSGELGAEACPLAACHGTVEQDRSWKRSRGLRRAPDRACTYSYSFH